MSRDDATVSVVPADCTPGWRDLPALAWVIARAYAPEGGPRLLARAVAGISMVVWLPVLMVMCRSGQVGAIDRRAVVTVARLQNPVLLLGALALLVVVSGWCVYTMDGASGLWLVGGALVIGTTVLRPCRVVRVQPAMWRVRKALSARDPDGPIYEMGALAAWPRRHGHGNHLLSVLLPATSPRGFVVAYPRDDELRQWYLRLGMLEHEPGGALYLDLRKAR